MSAKGLPWDALFAALSNSHWKLALVISGGGTRVIDKCFRRAGASKNFVEAVVPYSRAAMMEYLGREPAGSSASDLTAAQLAEVAHGRATRLCDGGDERDALGISLVAALPTQPPRRGEDRVHIVLRSADRHIHWAVTLEKGSHTRDSAEAVAEQVVLMAIHDFIGGTIDQPCVDGAEVTRRELPL